VAIIGNKIPVYDGSLCDRHPGTRYVVAAGVDFLVTYWPLFYDNAFSQSVFTPSHVLLLDLDCFLALEPPVGQDLLMHEVSRSHTATLHSRQDSSGRVISSSQRPRIRFAFEIKEEYPMNSTRLQELCRELRNPVIGVQSALPSLLNVSGVTMVRKLHRPVLQWSAYLRQTRGFIKLTI